MRNISFMLTTPQFIARTKTVTRRMGWRFAKVGDVLCGVEKSQGLGAGGKIKRLGHIKLIDVHGEPLNEICANLSYGYDEMIKEGFPPGHQYFDPTEFILFFCKSHKGCKPTSWVTRLEFKYLDAL